jgi:hypothetical protein
MDAAAKVTTREDTKGGGTERRRVKEPRHPRQTPQIRH